MRNLLPKLLSSAVYLTDDAGRRVEVYSNVIGKKPDGSDEDELPCDKPVAPRPTPAPPPKPARWWHHILTVLWCVGALGGIYLGCRSLVMTISRLLGVHWLWASAILAGLLVIVCAIWPFTFGRLWSRQVKIWHIASHLRKGLCAACEYRIITIAPDAQGRRTCPECAAIWNVDLWRTEFADHTPPHITSRRRRPHVADAVNFLMPLAADQDEARVFDMLKSARSSFWTPWLFLSDIACLAFCASLLYAVSQVPVSARGTVATILALIWLTMVAGYLWIRYKASRADRVLRVLRARLAANACPCCAHALSTQPTRHGWRNCPACGGAWLDKRRGNFVAWRRSTATNAPDT